MSSGWITTTVVLTVLWIGRRQPPSRGTSKLKMIRLAGRSCRRCWLILRSGLRPSLRLSQHNHPRFSHKDWTKKPEGDKGFSGLFLAAMRR